nr:MAG TPA: hypothetical protein [Caudoviricetes sp.]
MIDFCCFRYYWYILVCISNTETPSLITVM